MDKKIIAMVILFIIFISGFISAAMYYGEKQTYETDHGREERRSSEDEQIEYETIVQLYYLFFIIGIVGFMFFFELSRYHWIEMGKKLARFEYLHELDVKKRAIEEIRIQTIIREEGEAKEKSRFSAKKMIKDKIGIPKIKKGKKIQKSEPTEAASIPLAKPIDFPTFKKPSEDSPPKPDIESAPIKEQEQKISETPILQPPIEEKPILPIIQEEEDQNDDELDREGNEDVQENNEIVPPSDIPHTEIDEGTDEDIELCTKCFTDGEYLGFGKYKCPQCGHTWHF